MRLHGKITEVPTAWGSKFVAQLYRQSGGHEIKVWELGFGNDSLARTSLEAEVKRLMTPIEEPQVVYDRYRTGRQVMASGIGKLIKVNVRGQVSLGSLAQYDLYLGSIEEDGTIVLRPASVIPVKRKVGNEQA